MASQHLFEGQRDKERVLFMFRRHILTARKGLYWLLFMVTVGIVPIFLWRGAGWTLLVWMGFIFVGLIGLVYAYMLWYFSVYVVTNERVRQISQKGLFSKSEVDLGMERIHSVAYEVPGFFATVFGYGTLLIQTQVGDLTVSNVSNPGRVYNKLQNALTTRVKEQK